MVTTSPLAPAWPGDESSGPTPSTPSKSAEAPQLEARAEPQQALEVLLIEHDDTLARELELILESDGYRVTTTADALEALIHLEQHRPAVVITATFGPRLDGFGVCRRIKERDDLRGVAVMLLSSPEDPNDVLKGLESGADDFVFKPFGGKDLLARVGALAHRSSDEDQPGAGLELNFTGREYLVTPARLQIFDQLIGAMHENEELLGSSSDLGRALKTIGQLEENQRVILDGCVDGMMVVDRGWVVRYINPAAEKLFGQSGKELCGQPMEFGLPEYGSTELEISRPEAETISVEVNRAKITYKGESAHLVSLHDISERTRALEEIQAAQREHGEMRERFLSHVSHELRSPLTAIHNFVQLLLRGLGDQLDPEYKQYLEATHKNTIRLRDMIEELVEATRAQSSALPVEPSRISLADIVEETLAGLGLSHKVAEHGIQLQVEMPDDLPMVFADPERIKQVFTNLIENALKFTPEPGSITVRAEALPTAVDGSPGFVQVAVTDTGCGMKDEDCKRIFERMYQVKPHDETSRKGIGLGLYICKELVSRHGGRIWAESRIDQGTTFFFTLPVFSTRLLLGAIVGGDQSRPHRPPTLIAVDVHRPGRAELHPEDERFLNSTYRVLGEAVRNSPDMLLPRIGKTDCGEIFLILAINQESNTESLLRQLEMAFHSEKVLDGSSLMVTFSCDVLETLGSDGGGSLDRFLQTLETRAEDLIQQINGMNKEVRI